MDRVSHGARRDGSRTGPADGGATSRARGRGARGDRASGDRYRPGTRRATGEPLRASWRPRQDADEPATGDESGTAGTDGDTPPRRRSKLRRLLSTYGWRVYAVPVLLVITALVVVDTTRTDPELGASGDSGSSGTSSTLSSGEAAGVPEQPAEQVDLNIPTAKLPEGGDYTRKGRGTWHVVPGTGRKAGDGGELYTYTVEVEDGIDPASYLGDDGFAQAVEGILSDPRSWTGTGEVSLQRVDASHPDPDFRVSLTTPDTAHRPDICGNSIPFEASCYRRDVDGENRVVINLARWVRGALAFSGDMIGYRQYAINHEVGHALGNGHEGCAQDGALAPVMMQQTFGVANDYVARLNNTPGGDQGTVPADGKVCKPNAWPNPQAR
ncbi:DUF3152 domain-containing protein [Prauserella oleivorans]|uniref:DUF3152 domain-containing protein n=1 Tax=Prauserella oleivorans TaxID=1478153 RepID=A0ABW5WD25_9PSEU